MSRLPISIAAAAAAAALGLTLITTTVLAGPASYDPRTIEVEYGDLDLASTAGASTLYRRIAAAARDACDAHDPRDARAQRLADECVAQAIAGAVTQVDRPALTVLHRARVTRSEGVTQDRPLRTVVASGSVRRTTQWNIACCRAVGRPDATRQATARVQSGVGSRGEPAPRLSVAA